MKQGKTAKSDLITRLYSLRWKYPMQVAMASYFTN